MELAAQQILAFETRGMPVQGVLVRRRFPALTYNELGNLGGYCLVFRSLCPGADLELYATQVAVMTLPFKAVYTV